MATGGVCVIALDAVTVNGNLTQRFGEEYLLATCSAGSRLTISGYLSTRKHNHRELKRSAMVTWQATIDILQITL